MLIHINTESSGKFPVVFILKIYVPMFCCACSTSSWGSLILSGVFFAMKALGSSSCPLCNLASSPNAQNLGLYN